MCTIMTTTGSLTTIPEFEEAFALTKYRGPDDTRIISIDRMEMDMQGNIYTDYLAQLVEEGKVKESQIDECVRSILRLKYRLGLFDNPYVPEPDFGPMHYMNDAIATAEQVAEESAVLLKNDGVLPLSEERLKNKNLTVLITGPMADQKKEQLGTWVFDGEPEHSLTPVYSFQNRHKPFRCIYEPGLIYSRDKNPAGIAKAVAAAKKADVILFFCGEEAILSGEARCRANLDLPGAQIEMMDALVATGKPVVMIVMAGRPLTIGKQVDQAAAVLYAFHGGTMAGPALFNILTGKVVPSGKTPITFPKMVGQILAGEEVDVNDTETYDNNVIVVPSYLCEPVFADVNNYKELLLDSGYYTADQLK